MFMGSSTLRSAKVEGAPEEAGPLLSVLCKAASRSDELTTAPARLELQKLVPDRHALVAEYDAEGRFRYINDAFCRVTGYDREELIGMPHHVVNSIDHPAEVWQGMHGAVSRGDVWQHEVHNRRKDGSTVWLIETVAAIRDGNGAVTGYVNVGADITEVKALHAEMMKRGRLAQLGQLTATVAHEIRNPLGAVRTAAFVLERHVTEHNKKIRCAVAGDGKHTGELDVASQLQRINSGISRCDRIISELLDFTRSKALMRKSVAVDAWVRQMVSEEARNLPGSVKITCDLGLGEQSASMDPDQLRRVLINLLSNASEAMVGKGGEKPAAMYAEPSIVVTTRSSGRYLEFVVTDNGPGMAPEVAARVREPLFTTKSFGIGLGLPAVEKILEAHGGALEIESLVGRGTSMIARIPFEPCVEQCI